MFYLYITSLPHKRQLYQVAQWQESVLQVDGSAIDPDSRHFFFVSSQCIIKVEILSWDLCIQHIETSKHDFFYMKVINYFHF